MRRVLSLWVPHFLAAAEGLLDPALRGRPVLVVTGSYPSGRVVDVSPEAAVEGAAAGMSWRHAARRCPGSVLVPYRRERYAPLVEQLGNVVHRCAPWVEPFSSLPGTEGELFADLGAGDAAEGLATARRLQAEVRSELGLEARLALATGKLAARAASHARPPALPGESQDEQREGRDGLPESGFALAPRLVPERRERAFLAPLPVETLWDLRPESVRRLHLLGLRTLGHLAALPPRALMVPLGPAGVWYGRLARGLDPRRVAAWHPAPGETAAMTLDGAAPDDRTLVETYLARLARQLCGKLIRTGRYARILALTVCLDGGQRLYAMRQLKVPTHVERAVRETACALFGGLEAALAARAASVEALELTATGLETGGGVQLSLFGDESRAPALRAAVARLQDRYGERSVRSARGCLEDTASRPTGR